MLGDASLTQSSSTLSENMKREVQRSGRMRRLILALLHPVWLRNTSLSICVCNLFKANENLRLPPLLWNYSFLWLWYDEGGHRVHALSGQEKERKKENIQLRPTLQPTLAQMQGFRRKMTHG